MPFDGELNRLLGFLRAECRLLETSEAELIELKTTRPRKYQRMLRRMQRARRYQRKPQWVDMLTKDAKGKPLSNLANAVTVFRFHTDFINVFRWNEFALTVEIAARPPWLHETDNFEPHRMTDVEFVRAQAWLQGPGCGMSSVTERTTRMAVLDVAHDDWTHPVREYLEDLEWDGTDRLDEWLITHLGAEDTELHRAFGSKFLIGAVARAMCAPRTAKMDTMLVLEGLQGTGKSKAIRTLGGDAWFTDQLPDIGTKDAMIQCQGNWIIEAAEMDAMSRADVSRLKAFLTSESDDYRAPFGVVSEKHPRQCVFFGTTNPNGTGYLKDETGARRIWPVRCAAGWGPGRKIDLDALAGARDQIWAEAMARYLRGEKWWFDDIKLEAAAAEATDERYDADVWTDAVLGYVASRHYVTTSQVLEGPLQMKPADQDRRAQMRIGGILRKAGWARRKISAGATAGSFHYENPTPPEQKRTNSVVVPFNRGSGGVPTSGPLAGLLSTESTNSLSPINTGGIDAMDT